MGFGAMVDCFQIDFISKITGPSFVVDPNLDLSALALRVDEVLPVSSVAVKRGCKEDEDLSEVPGRIK